MPQTGTRLSEGYMGELKAADDYGLLVPYAGRRLMDDWPAATGCLYGLMTLDGVAVTDAVYSTVYYPSCWENGARQAPAASGFDAGAGVEQRGGL